MYLSQNMPDSKKKTKYPDISEYDLMVSDLAYEEYMRREKEGDGYA